MGKYLIPGVDELSLLVPPLALLILDEAKRVEAVVSGQGAIQTRSGVIAREPAAEIELVLH